jgi:hypothetical protein
MLIKSSTTRLLARMTSPQLADALEKFRIDCGNPQLTFARRLANENRWPLAYAHRVIREYMRFIYLAAISDHPVTPSVAVDQAWHLHLCYTRSYWQDMCERVLNRAIHHGPTQGGELEESKYRDAYLGTLKRYQSEFGQTPPKDIWPSADDRFSQMNAPVSVTADRFIVIEKHQARRVARIVGGIITIIAVLLTLGFTGNLSLAAGILVIGFGALLIHTLAAKPKPGSENKDASHGCGAGCSPNLTSGCNAESGCSASSGCGAGSGCGGGGGGD